MKRLPLAFFTAGATCVLVGMVWGAVMGSTEDFTLAPAHAHLNLVGWATLALMGGFYQLSGKSGRLGWINFVLSFGAVVVMIPSLALFLSGDKAADAGVIAGSMLAIAGMATFLTVVVSCWREAGAAETPASAGMKEAA
ncbi:MAG TPA: hypothetical protein VLI41_03640 [Phenylobacterium sp.]|uniref:hypothetical protein n=1 Tax=Phenylobacterium sp. TaxID=1871053 RepID=UPI002BA6D182|nr:hypothetical protein [Phenylobacterium sp.]HSV02276.1 hypothetical protein [Phenylobacterium sp.]